MVPNIPLLRRRETWRSYCKVTCGRESNMLWVMVVDVSRSESLNSYPQVLPLLSQNCGIFHVYLYMCIYIYVDIIHVYVYTVHACMCRESIHFFRVCSNDSLLPSRRSSARPCHLWTYPAIGPPQRQAADVPSEGTKLPSFLSRAAVVRYCCQ